MQIRRNPQLRFLFHDPNLLPGFYSILYLLYPHQDNQFGVFSRLTDLIKQSAHLAVFLNYVCSNSNPSPLLFYLITDVYKQVKYFPAHQ